MNGGTPIVLQRSHQGGGIDSEDHSFVLTPAESNVAMSLRMAAAVLMMGHARSAPVPSPSRMSRLSNGRTFKARSIASCPRSPDRCAKTSVLVIVGSVCEDECVGDGWVGVDGCDCGCGGDEAVDDD